MNAYVPKKRFNFGIRVVIWHCDLVSMEFGNLEARDSVYDRHGHCVWIEPKGWGKERCIRWFDNDSSGILLNEISQLFRWWFVMSLRVHDTCVSTSSLLVYRTWLSSTVRVRLPFCDCTSACPQEYSARNVERESSNDDRNFVEHLASIHKETVDIENRCRSNGTYKFVNSQTRIIN